VSDERDFAKSGYCKPFGMSSFLIDAVFSDYGHMRVLAILFLFWVSTRFEVMAHSKFAWRKF